MMNTRLARIGLLMSFVFFATGCVQVTRTPGPEDIMESMNLVDQGSAYLELGQLDRARSSFQVAWDVGQTAAALDGLGCVAFLEGDLLKAQSYFIRAYERDDSYTEAIANLALLYDRVGDTEHAEMLYRHVVEMDPKNYRARNNLAALMQGKSRGVRDEAALRELLRAASLSDHPLIKMNLETLE